MRRAESLRHRDAVEIEAVGKRIPTTMVRLPGLAADVPMRHVGFMSISFLGRLDGDPGTIGVILADKDAGVAFLATMTPDEARTHAAALIELADSTLEEAQKGAVKVGEEEVT